MSNAESKEIFKKALNEAFEQGKTIDEAVAYANVALKNDQKAGTKRRWAIMVAGGVAAILICPLLLFLIFQATPKLLQLVTGDAPSTPTLPGQGTPPTDQDISITVYDNNRQPISEVEFVTHQTYTLTVVARSSDNMMVTFRWVDSCANIGFSSNEVELANGEATTSFKPTVIGECELQVNLILAGGTSAFKTETFPIKIVSATSLGLSISAEMIDGVTLVEESVDAGKQYRLVLHVTNSDAGGVEDAVIIITLPEGVSGDPAPEIPANEIDITDNVIKILGIDVPAKQEVVRSIYLTASHIQNDVQKSITITDYRVEYGGQTQQGQAIEFAVRNPQPGDIVFDSHTVTVTQSVTSITVTAMDFNGKPIQYPISLTLNVDPPEAGSVNLDTVVTTNNGQATIEFTALDITATQATLIVQSGPGLVRHLPLEFSPMVVGVGSGNAENSLYHRLTDDTRSQIVILPNQAVESGAADTGNPDLVNGRIVYRLAVGTPVHVLGGTREIIDNVESKVFYRVAVQFWVPRAVTLLDEFPSGPLLPPGFLRIRQGESQNDSWKIITVLSPPPAEPAPSANLDLLESGTDIDDDNIIVRIVDNDSSQDWVLVEAEGWLAADVIGFADENVFQNVSVASTSPIGFVQTLIMPLANKGGRAAQFMPV